MSGRPPHLRALVDREKQSPLGFSNLQIGSLLAVGVEATHFSPHLGSDLPRHSADRIGHCIVPAAQLSAKQLAAGQPLYVHLLGTPQQLMAALRRLQQSLPAVSLHLNTAKSHFAYFHDSLTPLTSAVLSTLSANDIQLHDDCVGVVGAVVGRDDAAIRAGVHSVLSAAGGHDAFRRRLQLDEMPIQTAMLLHLWCLQ